MATMNISLPDKMKEWVESQIETGRFSNASDLMRDLIRNAQEKAGYIAYIQKAVDEGLASGFSEFSPDQLLSEIRKSANEQ